MGVLDVRWFVSCDHKGCRNHAYSNEQTTISVQAFINGYLRPAGWRGNDVNWVKAFCPEHADEAEHWGKKK